MTRRQRILQILTDISSDVSKEMIFEGFDGFTTEYVSMIADLDRSNVSRELNTLFDHGLVTKVTGKPMKFFSVQTLEDLGLKISDKDNFSFEMSKLKDIFSTESISSTSFDTLIGHEDSLKNAINKSKAAMLYPPNGLHSLLVGPSGVGKTMFVDLMFDFAVKSGVLNNNSKLVTFNCAEYSENPQLILSHLFGHTKGSFTGATTEKDGLVHEANNGILFLDEIHRLPAEGQEMLFMLMDKKQYRKLGAHEVINDVNVLIIAATTENIQSSLLQTFLRRIPMIIDIPSLQDRPVIERYNLLLNFFSEESIRTNMEIKVDKDVVRSFLAYTCIGNVGQFSSDIKLVCARAYLNAIVNQEPILIIDKTILPNQIIRGMIDSNYNKEIDKIENNNFNNGLLFSPNNAVSPVDYVSYNEDIYSKINKQYEKYNFNAVINNLDKDTQKIKNNLNTYVESLFDTVVDSTSNNEDLYKIVSPEIYEIVSICLAIAEKKLKRTFSKKTHISFAIHVNAIFESNISRQSLRDDFIEIQNKYPDEYAVAIIMKQYLSEELNFDFPESELIFFTLFLNMDQEKEFEGYTRILVLAHGNGVAANMAEVANTLLNTSHAIGMDMNLEEDVHTFYERVEEKVIEIHEGNGVIILVDMGSLKAFGNIITSKTGIPVKTIDMVSTLTVIEATRKTLLGEYSIDKIEHDILTMIKQQIVENNLVVTKRKLILSTCMTGTGAAVNLSDYVKRGVPILKDLDIEFINTNARDFDKSILNDYELVCVIGLDNLGLADVPYISTDSLILNDGIAQIEKILKGIFNLNDVETTNSNRGLSKIIETSLTNINLQDVMNLLDHSFNTIIGNNQYADYNRLLVAFYMHTSLVIERIINGHAYNYNGVEERIKSNLNLFVQIREGIRNIEEFYSINIPDTELAYIMDIFDTH